MEQIIETNDVLFPGETIYISGKYNVNEVIIKLKYFQNIATLARITNRYENGYDVIGIAMVLLQNHNYEMYNEYNLVTSLIEQTWQYNVYNRIESNCHVSDWCKRAIEAIKQHSDVLERIYALIRMCYSDRDISIQARANMYAKCLEEKIHALCSICNHYISTSENLNTERQLVHKMEKLPEHIKIIVQQHMNRLVGYEHSFAIQLINTIMNIPWIYENVEIHSYQQCLQRLQSNFTCLDDNIYKEIALNFCSMKLPKPILLVGPPGVGKTDICRFIAKYMFDTEIPLQSISMAGMTDEKKLIGHSSTYVASQPGFIVCKLIEAGTMNCIIRLDEIDKCSSVCQDILINLLDESNKFTDHYINIEMDLTPVKWIATCNNLSAISAPLRNRFHIIHLDGYTRNEKVHICKLNIIPNIQSKYLTVVEFDDDAIEYIIYNHVHDSGLRTAKRLLENIYVQAIATNTFHITAEMAAKFCKPIICNNLITQLPIGSSYCLTVSSDSGSGSVVLVTAKQTSCYTNSGGITVIGNVSDVLKESAQIAYNYICSKDTMRNHINIYMLWGRDVSGATPKDGPSAGVAIFISLYSLRHNIDVSSIASTGEIDVHGHVLVIGGINAKIQAAINAGCKHIIIPENNIQGVKEHLKNSINIHGVSNLNEVVDIIVANNSSNLL